MTRLETRKEQLLSCIVREHMATADPIASDALKNKYDLDVSPATVRNEMVALEKAGFLRQPHTSAGRVPTEKGYRYYIDYCMREQNVREEIRALQKNVGSGLDSDHGGAQDPALQEQTEQHMKRLARALAERLSEGIFIGFSPESTYYTGLSYLFEQPEFESVDLVRHISEIVDNLDSIVANLFENIAPGVHVFVGSDSPFGNECGVILFRSLPHNQPLLGVLGPMRMNYDRNVAIMRGVEKMFIRNYET